MKKIIGGVFYEECNQVQYEDTNKEHFTQN
jgi:hypothetical protein